MHAREGLIIPGFPLFKNTIRNKLMLLLLAATIVPIASSMVISYIATKNSITEEAVATNARLLSLGKTNILNYMNNINQKSLAVYNSMNVPRSLYYLLEHDMEDEVFPNDLSDVIRNRNLLKDHLYNIYQSIQEFAQVRLYVVKQNTTYLLRNDDLKVGQNEQRPTDFNSSGKTSIEPTHLSHYYGLDLKGSTQEPVFTLHRPIFRAPSDELLARLSIDVKLNVLADLNRQLYDEGEQFYIVDKSGSVILSSEAEVPVQEKVLEWFTKVARAEEDSGHIDYKGDGFAGIIFHDRVKTSYMDWYLVKLSPYTHLYERAGGIARINAFIGIGALAIAVLATLYVSLRITKPLLRLIGYVNKIETGQLNTAIDIHSNDEIGVLARRFRSMMQTINNLILKEYRLEIASKTNQLKALQAQVNPHFLYNAMQSIGTVALQHKDMQVYSLLTSLGKMMRYQMSTERAVVELAKEIDYVQAYLDLQKQRFDTALEVTLDIDPRTRPIVVPKMILQPIVENFFKHGFVPDGQEPAKLRVASSLEEGSLTIRIEDNGKGMSEEQLIQAMHQLTRGEAAAASDWNSPASEEGGIGLRNVLSRLQLHFHPKATLSLYPVTPHGLGVMLHIPLEEGAVSNV
ncbi:two-component system sensor histidine kinase YesM [Paenibacillus phyllosphaerae]|uniref:Two-component system sensor histidine kinase YesM n=1 Tax=Paenibacillus phyllosphaerae TaxID=274593 RepID=A0A7W5AXS9_9BACL|nr:histidine kinase [Paenibacillus phyllosphaerae]MBB3110730.1 two-component system sensor histidine kinase YesM [Paenibacillus phyllosphaerae]